MTGMMPAGVAARALCVLSAFALGAVVLAGCDADPAAVGITGPYPEGVPPVTLTRALPRMERSDDTPGVRVDTADRLTANTRARASAASTRRYYGYDH